MSMPQEQHGQCWEQHFLPSISCYIVRKLLGEALEIDGSISISVVDYDTAFSLILILSVDLDLNITQLL